MPCHWKPRFLPNLPPSSSSRKAISVLCTQLYAQIYICNPCTTSTSIHLSVINNSVIISFSKISWGVGGEGKRIKTDFWVLGISPIAISASNPCYMGKDLPLCKRVWAEFRDDHHLSTWLKIVPSILPSPSDSCILGYHQGFPKQMWHSCYDLSSQLIA